MAKDLFDYTLTQLRACRGKPVAADCPDDHQLAAWLDGALPEKEDARVMGHLANCIDCRRIAVLVSEEKEIQLDEMAAEAVSSTKTAARFEAELAAMEQALGIKQKSPAPGFHPSVMVVDDDPIYLSSLVDTLSRDYDVTACTNGKEALEKIHPGIQSVVLDIKMAGISGMDVAERWRNRRVNAPVIFNTGYPGEYVREDIVKRFAPFDYVTKDDPDLLLSSLRRAIVHRPGAQY
jgi:CheY-like chemotaxis protein